MAPATEAQLKELGLENLGWINISQEGAKLIKTVKDFVLDDCAPAEAVMHEIHQKGEEKGWTRLQIYEAEQPVFKALQEKAKSLGLWNLFLTGEEFHGKIKEVSPISTLEYAIVAEWMGRSGVASSACNCQAPDTGTFEQTRSACSFHERYAPNSLKFVSFALQVTWKSLPASAPRLRRRSG